MLVAFSVAPSGSPLARNADAGGVVCGHAAESEARDDASVHDAVAAAVKIVRESGLPNRTDAMFTTIEGTWDEVFDVIRRATEAAGAFGSRVSLVLKADIRSGYRSEITKKLERLETAITESADLEKPTS